MSRVVLGIDPGLKGGFALYENNRIILAREMPVIGGWVHAGEIVTSVLLACKRPDVVHIEKVGAMPGQGVSSMFKFGTGYGQLVGMCQAMTWPYELITPQRWKGKVLVGTARDKDAACAYVSRRFPEVQLIPDGCRVPHDGIADAVCLAAFTPEK